MLETDFETGDIKPETDFIAIATQFTSSLTTSDRAVVTVYNTSGRRDRGIGRGGVDISPWNSCIPCQNLSENYHPAPVVVMQVP